MRPRLTLRRVVQAAGAALGSAAAPIAAPAAPMSAADPDAELHRLLDAFTVARAAWDATSGPEAAAEDRARAAYPPRPGALWSTTVDQLAALPAQPTGREKLPAGGYRLFYTPEDVEKLRAAPPVTRWAEVGDDVDPPPTVLDQKGEARRQAIIAAQDGWMREREVIADAIGLTAAREASTAAGLALSAIEDALVSWQPRTVPGLVRKAVWMVDQMNLGLGVEDLGQTFARQVAAFGGAGA